MLSAGPKTSGLRETRSQRLFLAATHIHPDSLTIKGDREFFLFMQMRAEFHWISYEMTSRRWVDATAEYNRRLVGILGEAVVKKNPLALLHKLGEMEPRLIERVMNNNFTSKRNSESFWRHHCTIINLVKADATTGKKHRKIPTCSRCKTIMYPGPTKSITNHRRGICADGVKSKSTAESSDLPHWPQPNGIFTDGRFFHTKVFFKSVKEIYELAASGTGLSMMLVEAQAFLLMLTMRTIILTDADGEPTTALFRLYPGFDVVDAGDRVVNHEGTDCLRIDYLEQEA